MPLGFVFWGFAFGVCILEFCLLLCSLQQQLICVWSGLSEMQCEYHCPPQSPQYCLTASSMKGSLLKMTHKVQFISPSYLFILQHSKQPSFLKNPCLQSPLLFLNLTFPLPRMLSCSLPYVPGYQDASYFGFRESYSKKPSLILSPRPGQVPLLSTP